MPLPPVSREWREWLNSFRSPGQRRRYAADQRRRREVARLLALPRYTATTSDLTGRTMELVDGPSFAWSWREIYKEEIYAFRAPHPAPYIIDGGANVGVSVLYFKDLYPGSEIVAFEPDPAVFAALERNVRAARVDGVTLVPRALWSSATTLPFHAEGADGGHLAPGGAVAAAVSTVRLRDYLDRPVDFLKLDIEGAETEVLCDAADRLGAVARIYVEYHSVVGRAQTLPELLGILRDAGFRLHVQHCAVSPHPFLERRDYHGLDLQLHVFGVRS
jgi:FkbM family methyltransferase